MVPARLERTHHILMVRCDGLVLPRNSCLVAAPTEGLTTEKHRNAVWHAVAKVWPEATDVLTRRR